MALEDARTEIDAAFAREGFRGKAYENAFAGATSFLRVDQDFVQGHEDPHFALAFARILNRTATRGLAGRVTTYEGRSVYQIVVEALSPTNLSPFLTSTL